MMSRFKKHWIMAAFMAVLLTATVAWALEWHTANQATVAWDAVTTDVSGNPVPAAGERVTYVVYLANAATDPNKTNPAEVGSTQNTTLTFTLGAKGSYFVGLKSVLEADDGAGNWTKASESEVAWSDDPQYAQGGVTFGIRYYPAPSAPGGLRPGTE
jgi:hypothetical protein